MEKTMHLLEKFSLPEGAKTTAPFGNGHINSTFLITIEGVPEKYILQRINSYVFVRPKEVMENMIHITEYLQNRIREEGGDPDRETIRLIPSVSSSAGSSKSVSSCSAARTSSGACRYAAV